MLLAVDLGLRTGWAVYDGQGHLIRFESRHFGNRGRLRTGVSRVVRTLPAEIDIVVAEGDAKLGHLWFECREHWETELVSAETWRQDLLWQRQRRSGAIAKASALELAACIIREDACGWSNRLNDDTAEAILLGYWAVRRRGWRSGHLLDGWSLQKGITTI
jgi:hypothetical protein